MKAVIVFFALFSTAISWGQATAPPEDPAKYAWEIIDRTMKDSNPDKRKELAVAASLGGANQAAITVLSKLQRDHDVQVRLATCGSLTSLKNKRTLQLLRNMLEDEVPEVAFCAAQGLGQLGDPAGRRILLSVLEGETKTRSGYITTEKRNALRMLKVPKELFANMFKLGIGFAPVPGLGTGLSSFENMMAQDNQMTGRALAALALAKDKKPETLKALREALEDKEWPVRAAAIRALALRNQSNVRNDLIPLLDDKKETVRYCAAFAYLRLAKVKRVAFQDRELR